MRIGNRLFPYPVLNSDPLLSSYKSGCTFALYYNDEIVGDELILRDIFCNVQSEFLTKLIAEDKAEIRLLVESPEALYRRTYVISTSPDELRIPCAEVCVQYILSAFIVAKEDITVYGDVDEFVNEYSELTFTFERHDILAVDEAHKRGINFDLGDDLTKSSIFVVAMDKTLEEGLALYSYTNEQIEIVVDEKTFCSYDSTKNSALKQTYMALLAVPALTYCVHQLIIKGGNSVQDTIDEASIDYKWFASFCSAFSKKYAHDFSEQDIDKLDDYIQQLFDYPTGKGIVFLSNLVTEGESANED